MIDGIDGTDTLFSNLILNIHDTPRPVPISFAPHNWLKTAKIFNQKMRQVPSKWVIENADVVVVLFSCKGTDRNGIIDMFQDTYEHTKYANLPVEVLNVPLDETPEEAAESFENQANWFTLRFGDPLIHELKFMYGISCVPYIYVLRPTCEVVSNNGIADLDTYGKNAIVCWMSVSPIAEHERKLTKEAKYYGHIWKYLGQAVQKHDYHRKFGKDGGEDDEDATAEESPEGEATEVPQDVTEDSSRKPSQIASQNASKKNSEEQLKDELRDLHYTC